MKNLRKVTFQHYKMKPELSDASVNEKINTKKVQENRL